MTGGDWPLASLERRRATTFFVAGGLLVVFAVNTGVRTFLGRSSPLVQDFIAPAGFLFGVLGLLGLYPVVADRTPTLGRVAGVLAGVTAAYWIVILAGSVAEATGFVASVDEAVPLVVFVGLYVATTLTYGLFGAVGLYANDLPPVVGLLVLGPAVMFLLLMGRAAPAYVIDAGHALFHLGIGVALVADDVRSDRAEPAPDSLA